MLVAQGQGWWADLPSAGPAVLAGRRADLRVRAGRLGDTAAVLVTNEGEDPLTLAASGAAWDPWTGTITALSGTVELPRRGSLWLTEMVPEDACASVAAAHPGAAVRLAPWASEGAPLGDWTTDPAWETFAGAATFSTGFQLAEPADLLLDLGAIGDNADVRLNGEPVSDLFWPPYRCAVPASATRAGRNTLTVRVTNSSANRFEGTLRPSGLLGPVTLHIAAR